MDHENSNDARPAPGAKSGAALSYVLVVGLIVAAVASLFVLQLWFAMGLAMAFLTKAYRTWITGIHLRGRPVPVDLFRRTAAGFGLAGVFFTVSALTTGDLLSYLGAVTLLGMASLWYFARQIFGEMSGPHET